jgi:hypothetical protein
MSTACQPGYNGGMPQNPYEAPKRQFSLRHLFLAIACFSVTCATWSWAWELSGKVIFALGGLILLTLALVGLAALGAGAGFLLGNAWKGFFAAMIICILMALFFL